MIESHLGTMVSARIQQHLEYLLEESSVPELDEAELSALLFLPGQVNENSSVFSRHAFVPQQQNTDLCSRCSNSRSALIHLIDDGWHQPQAETPEQAGRNPNREWSSGPFPRHVAQGTGVRKAADAASGKAQRALEVDACDRSDPWDCRSGNGCRLFSGREWN